MSKQKANDALAAALLVFFLTVMIVGLYSLGKMHSSNIALDASVVGIIGTIVSLFGAVALILGDNE